MARFMREATADRKRDVERWKSDLALAAASGDIGNVVLIRRWIAEANQIIADSGY